jgi:hypothetical protein
MNYETYFATVAVVVPVFFLAFLLDFQKAAKRAKRTGMGVGRKAFTLAKGLIFYGLGLAAEAMALAMFITIHTSEGVLASRFAAPFCLVATMILALAVAVRAISEGFMKIRNAETHRRGSTVAESSHCARGVGKEPTQTTGVSAIVIAAIASAAAAAFGASLGSRSRRDKTPS